MKKNISFLMVGILIGAMLFGTVAFASNVSVDFVPLKYFFNGVQKYPPSDQQGFIYNGRTYVPLRFLAESLGQSVVWEGETSSIHITSPNLGGSTNITPPDIPTDPTTVETGYLTDVISPYDDYQVTINDQVTLGNDIYNKTIVGNNTSSSAAFDLKGQYSKITLLVTGDSYNPFKVMGDKETLWQGNLQSSDLPTKLVFGK